MLNLILSVFFYFIFPLWLCLALIGFLYTKRIIKKYEKYPRLQFPQNWQAFIRKDNHHWNNKQIIIGCFLRFPFKLIAMLMFIIGTFFMVFITIKLGKIGVRAFKFYGRYVGTFVGKCLFKINQQNNLNKLLVQTPIVISNHVCWFDIFYLITTFYPISFVSKDQIRTIPIIGKIATNAQTIYLKRQNQQNRLGIVSKIKERVQLFLQNAKKQQFQNVYPLIIFPEGTTSNGNSILRFKLGAFNDLSSIMIVSLNYQCQNFDVGMVQISQSECFVLSLCLSPSLKSKTLLVQALPKQQPEQYSQRCRKTISEMTGFKLYDSGYRQRLQHSEIIKKQIEKTGIKNQSKITKTN